MSRATTVTYPADWSMYDANQAVGDGQPLSIITVPMSGNVRVGPVIQNEVGTFTGFNQTDFTIGGSVEVLLDAAPLNGVVPSFSVWLTSGTSSTETINSEGVTTQYYWTDLMGVDPTATDFAVQVQPLTVSEITSINCSSAHPTPPTNAVPPTLSLDSVNNIVTCNPGSWSGFPTPTISFMWPDGSTGSTLALSPAFAGEAIICTVTATNASGSASLATPQLGPYTAPVFTSSAILPASPFPFTALSASNSQINGGYPGSPSVTYTWNTSTGGPSQTVDVDANAGTTYSCNIVASNVFGSSSANPSYTMATVKQFTVFPFCNAVRDATFWASGSVLGGRFAAHNSSATWSSMNGANANVSSDTYNFTSPLTTHSDFGTGGDFNYSPITASNQIIGASVLSTWQFDVTGGEKYIGTVLFWDPAGTPPTANLVGTLNCASAAVSFVPSANLGSVPVSTNTTVRADFPGNQFTPSIGPLSLSTAQLINNHLALGWSVASTVASHFSLESFQYRVYYK